MNAEIAAMVPDDAFDFHTPFCKYAEYNWARFLNDSVSDTSLFRLQHQDILTASGVLRNVECVQKQPGYGTQSYLLLSQLPGFLATEVGSLGRPLLATPRTGRIEIASWFWQNDAFSVGRDWYVTGIARLLARQGVSVDVQAMRAHARLSFMK